MSALQNRTPLKFTSRWDFENLESLTLLITSLEYYEIIFLNHNYEIISKNEDHSHSFILTCKYRKQLIKNNEIEQKIPKLI